MKHACLRLRLPALAALATLLVSTAQAAVGLSVNPQSATAQPGGSTAVTVYASNSALGSSIGGYVIDLAYDAALWTPTSVSFSTMLGDVASFEALGSYDFSVPGLLRITEVSLLGTFDPVTLAGIQPAAGTKFELATLSFSSVGTGLGQFRVAAADLTDAAGAPLALAPVPEPGSQVLMALGAAALAWRFALSSRRSAD